jgi:hypothetical protein
MRSHSKKPEIGDLVDWRGEIGVVKRSRGIYVQVHWMWPWFCDDRLVDASWLRRVTPEMQVISRGYKKK